MAVIGQLSRMLNQLSLQRTPILTRYARLSVPWPGVTVQNTQRMACLSTSSRASAAFTGANPALRGDNPAFLGGNPASRGGNPAFRGDNPAFSRLSRPEGPLTVVCRQMATLTQMSKNHNRWRKQKVKRKPGFTEGRPQLRGVVLKTLAKKPKKPNSALRKCVRIKLSTGREATAYIPGEGHNLQEHSIVLVEGGRVQDTPGVKLKCCRGKYDLAHVIKKTV